MTGEIIMVYLKLGISCQKKAPVSKKGLGTNPILHSVFNSHAQLDLVDMQSQSYDALEVQRWLNSLTLGSRLLK